MSKLDQRKTRGDFPHTSNSQRAKLATWLASSRLTQPPDFHPVAFIGGSKILAAGVEGHAEWQPDSPQGQHQLLASDGILSANSAVCAARDDALTIWAEADRCDLTLVEALFEPLHFPIRKPPYAHSAVRSACCQTLAIRTETHTDHSPASRSVLGQFGLLPHPKPESSHPCHSGSANLTDPNCTARCEQGPIAAECHANLFIGMPFELSHQCLLIGVPQSNLAVAAGSGE